jgi:putative membrane protein
MLDLVLAILHHLTILCLAGADLKTLGAVDAGYGATAGLILVVGFSRVFLGAKGSAFYIENPVFWTKIAAFAVVGVLSIWPTVAILKWRKQAKADPAFAPSAGEVARVRRMLVLELLVFALIPVFAAAMARGYGL